MWWYQAVHERRVTSVGLPATERLADGRRLPALTSVPHLIYVDNFAVFGQSESEVREKLDKVQNELTRCGLPLHPASVFCGCAKILGWMIGGSPPGLQPSAVRIWRIRFAVRWVLRLPRVSLVVMQQLVGHLVFVSLCRREVLAILSSVFRFAEKMPRSGAAVLWSSVRRELKLWDDMAPLFWAALDPEFSEDVVAVDASFWGLCAVRAQARREVVEEACVSSERWRFRGRRVRSSRQSFADAARAGRDGLFRSAEQKEDACKIPLPKDIERVPGRPPDTVVSIQSLA